MSNYSQVQIQSKTIDFLRLPLIIGVILVHSAAVYMLKDGKVNIDSVTQYPVFENIRYLFSYVIGRIPSRMFFFIAGFLYFNNLEKWEINKYKSKTKNRFHTLFVPYMFWNLLSLLIIFLIQKIPEISSLLSGHRLSVRDLNFEDFLSVFWNTADTGNPLHYQFWFIRDLLVIALLSPIVWLIIRYLRLIGVLILGIFWFFEIFHIIGLSNTATFFFTCGAYFSLNKKNIIEFSNKLFYTSIISYPIIAIIDVYTRTSEFNIYIHNIGIVFGIIFLFNIISAGIKHGVLNNSHFYSSSSFFVFAAHEPLLTALKKVLIFLLKPDSAALYYIVYFLPVVLTLVITLSSFLLIKKIAPKFLGIITGDRI